MNKKRLITYIKNGEEKSKEFNLFTKKEIIREVFSNPYYQSGISDFYRINENIEFLSITNMTFPKGIRMVIPEDCVVVLNDCIFKGGCMEFVDGTIELNNPTLNPDYYTNRIYLVDTKDANILIDYNNKSHITITGKSDNFSLNGYGRIETISLSGKKATLKNIEEINNLKLNNQETNIEDCSFVIDLNNQTQDIQTETLNIKDSSIYYKFEQVEETQDNEKESNVITTDVLNLIYTNISAKNTIGINAKTITMDSVSSIKTTDKIKLLDDTYTTKGTSVKLDINSIKEINSRRELISILKGIRNTLPKQESKKRSRRI